MAFTRDWDETSPADSDQIRYGAGKIRDFKADTRERLLTWFPQISNINNAVAIAQTTPAAGKIPVAGGDGKLDSGWLPSYVPPQNTYVAVVYGSSIQEISTGSGTVSFDTEITDPQNQFDTTEYKFTAGKAGVYRVTLSGSAAARSIIYPVNNGSLTLRVTKNGSTVLHNSVIFIDGGGERWASFGFTTACYLNGSGDYIKITFSLTGCNAKLYSHRTLAVEYMYTL